MKYRYIPHARKNMYTNIHTLTLLHERSHTCGYVSLVSTVQLCVPRFHHMVRVHMFLMYHVNVGHVYYTYMKCMKGHITTTMSGSMYVHVCMCTCIYVCIHTHSYVCMYDVYVVQNVSNLSKPGKRKINKFLLFSAKKNKLCTGVQVL